ncbi:hypothetical protein CGZ94_15405 [Enemella evansiae]|uniref:Glycosyl hydrolase family 43 n=1 Tax=Enemella evansiae TaxID=2016499 RepID=A0A255G794_9ACTN|nr:family 43 glycosylhydrolase [Enemella evansiae]OYO11788.1 hypothetical protein CGZ94_15405 [Enemella evansiae]
MSKRRVISGTVVAALTAGLALVGFSTSGAEAASASSVTPLADPDTLVAENGRYVTYGTSLGKQSGRCNTTAKVVPYLVHGSGENPGMGECVSGDAMPGGPGAWAQGAVWAPGVARHGDRYFMYYTASRKGSGQKCIGRAVSKSATGPFTDGKEWACPPAGRWAIDANPFVSGGKLYVAYRDDAVASGAETGLSVVRVGASGFADWSTRRTLLLSTDIRWDTTGTSGGTHVIENPSMFRTGNGEWYVTYSGNNWDSPRYATGIARCGTNPLPSKRCSPIGQGVTRPYFGFRGAGDINPLKGLPANHRGPGGMDVFQTPSGDNRVVWHWWNGQRYVKTGDLKAAGSGFVVD